MSKKKDGRKNNCPPFDSRWKKGQSGNPRGRPPKVLEQHLDRLSHEALRNSFLQAGKDLITIKENGQELKIPKIDALAKKLMNSALGGDMRAAALFFKYINSFAKDQDKVLMEIIELNLNMQDKVFETSLDPGSPEHVHAMINYFKYRRAMRNHEGSERWIYLDDEPITNEDWAHLIEINKSLNTKIIDKVKWPPDYPSHMREREYENMSDEELLINHLAEMAHRKEMRAKEGEVKWPYLIEEPVSDEDWALFKQHIQDKLDKKDHPQQWPPEYWDD